MIYAIISDIHGNSWALKAVLKDIRNKQADKIYDLGDSLYGPLDPKGTFELMIENEIESICGNEDRLIIKNLSSGLSNPTLEYVKEELNESSFSWLKELPKTRTVGNDILLCHGTPEKNAAYLLEELHPGCIKIKNTDDLEKILKGINASFVFCGHSHRPGIAKTKNSLIINPGSVGLPAYEDNLPIPHKMETYSNHARYCILIIEEGKTWFRQMSVKYDYKSAAKKAEINGRSDWAKWLETGIA